MDKIKIGIPKNIDYSYSYFFKEFFEYLNFEVVSSHINSSQTINLDDISYLKDKSFSDELKKQMRYEK